MRSVDSNAEEMLWCWSCKARAIAYAIDNFTHAIENMSKDLIIKRDILESATK